MAMHVAIARITLYLPEKQSLKEKRMLVRSVTRRLRNSFNIAVAEVDTLDMWQRATLGLACVSNDPRHANEQVDRAVHFIEGERLDAEIGDVELELIAL